MNKVRPKSTGNGGTKTGQIINATVIARPIAQPTLCPVSAEKKRRQKPYGELSAACVLESMARTITPTCQGM